jgi:hypothetical protein
VWLTAVRVHQPALTTGCDVTFPPTLHLVHSQPALFNAVYLEPEPTGTIPPLTRKRKAAEATISSGAASLPSSKRILASAGLGPEAPPTPVTTASNGMDYEDDFMSAVSSEDDILPDDSDNDDDMSGPEGMSLTLPCFASDTGAIRVSTTHRWMARS